jgi:hypothetical protein
VSQAAVSASTKPLWVPLLVAAIGVAGTLIAGIAGTLIAQRLTIKRQLRTPAAANGSNRIALTCPPSSNISALTCLDDLYLPSCHSFTPRESVNLDRRRRVPSVVSRLHVIASRSAQRYSSKLGGRCLHGVLVAIPRALVDQVGHLRRASA